MGLVEIKRVRRGLYGDGRESWAGQGFNRPPSRQHSKMAGRINTTGFFSIEALIKF